MRDKKLCPHCQSKETSKYGFYRRKRNRRKVQRYFCRSCVNTFSDQTTSTTYRQKRPDLNEMILKDVGTGVGIRKMALKHQTTKTTIQRKIVFLSSICLKFHLENMNKWTRDAKPIFQFDELETYEHSSHATVTVPTVVESKSHFIVSTQALYDKSRSHYPRLRNRHNEAHADEIKYKGFFIKSQLSQCRKMKPKGHIVIETDKKTTYPQYLVEAFDDAPELLVHIQYNASDEDLKKKLFSVNNVMACMRADKAMLRRKTWHVCQKLSMLNHHLAIYNFFSNYVKKKIYSRTYIDKVTGKKKKKQVAYQTPAQNLGILDRPLDLKRFLQKI